MDEAKALMGEVIKQKVADDAASAKRKEDEAAKATEAGNGFTGETIPEGTTA